jgi:hypothetical protein
MMWDNKKVVSGHVKSALDLLARMRCMGQYELVILKRSEKKSRR